MNAANNGPIGKTLESYRSLRIPFARTHDTPLGMEYGGHCIDINQVFPDFSANVNSPESYDFTNSDVVLQDILKAGTKPFYRLGQSIEHQKKKYGIYPPANYRKWAKHLKKYFPNLKIGGPAFANPRKYGPEFLDCVKEKGAPLDFFSHHMYHRKPARIVEDMRIVRKMLDEKGFGAAESILNEWNFNRSWEETDNYSVKMRPTVKGAAFVGAVMCACQNEPVDMLMYYDLRPNTTWCGIWSPLFCDPRPPYWALYYWAELADYGTQVESGCDTENIYTCAARSKDGGVRLLVVRYYHKDDSQNEPCEVSLKLPDGWRITGVRMTDSQGMDRRPAVAGAYTLESSSIALFEIQPL